MTFEITPGTIYSALFPFSDLSANKKRPVLALGGLDTHGDVRVAFITKSPATEENGFALAPEDYDGVPLPFASHLRVDKTFNLHGSRLEKPVATLSHKGYERALRKLISLDIPKFVAHSHSPRPFIPGTTVIPAAGKVLGKEEIQNMVEASLDGWLTTGRFNDAFEKKLAEFLGVKYVLTTNFQVSQFQCVIRKLTAFNLSQPGKLT